MSAVPTKALLLSVLILFTACMPSGESRLAEGKLKIHQRAVERVDTLIVQLMEADSLLAVAGAHLDSLQRLMVRVDNPVEPYFQARGTQLPATGVQGRMAPDNVFYIVACATRPFNRVEVGEAATPTVYADGERNYTFEGVTTVTYIGAEADSVGRYAAEHQQERLQLRLMQGDRAVVTRTLSDSELRSLATAWQLAEAHRQVQLGAIRHQKLERALDVARQQVARTSADTVSAVR